MLQHDKIKQPWLQSLRYDGLFIILPGFLALLITILLPDYYKNSDTLPLAGWVILVLLIDVAHVYSTLFRTYLHKENYIQHKGLYIAVPIVCYVVCVLLYSMGPMIFWRVLAYLAVFHFIRQQYGFMRLYSRQEAKGAFSSRVDTLTIYAATLYPMIFWHCSPDRNFSWFVQGDFVIYDLAMVKQISSIIYVSILVLYVAKELRTTFQNRFFNIPRNLLIISTALTWYFGIVYYNGDITFTLLNVVAHGIPYMALIRLFDQKNNPRTTSNKTMSRRHYSIIGFLLIMFVLAFIEEGLWDGMIWHEREQIFGVFSVLPSLKSKELQALVIPLLSLPQSTHYALDGFIWKRTGKYAHV